VTTNYTGTREVNVMAQHSPERRSVDEILKLVDQLSAEEHDELVDALKLQWLRKAMDESEQSLTRHGARPADQVFDALKQRLEDQKAGE
jgi:hypothetical protein